MSEIYTRGEPATRSGANGLAVAALVCGIVGVFLLNIILGPLAVIFGAVSLRNANRGAGKRGLAMAGLVLGVIDIALFIVAIAVTAHSSGWHIG